MDAFSNSELVDMMLIYGEARQNSLLARRLYAERYPARRLPTPRLFVRIVQRLRDTGYVQPNRGRGGGRQHQHDNMVNDILDAVHAEPTISTRRASQQLGVSRSSVWRILRDQNYHPFHFQRVQGLTAPDYQFRIRFCNWLLQKHTENPNFPSYIIFSDEATFTREGVHNYHNCHYWSQVNPHVVVRGSFQHRFSINVWAGIVNGMLLGPYILPNRMTGANYLLFLQNTLPELLENVSLNVRQQAWFQHDGAPPHYALNVREHLNQVFEDRWIGRGGPVAWPARSPDLNPLDFYFWGNFKSLVYDNQNAPENEEELRQRIENSAEIIRVQNSCQDCTRSLIQRAAMCVGMNGANFEQYL